MNLKSPLAKPSKKRARPGQAARLRTHHRTGGNEEREVARQATLDAANIAAKEATEAKRIAQEKATAAERIAYEQETTSAGDFPQQGGG